MRASILAIAGFAVIYPAVALVFPEAVPLYRRQAPGTPEYDCHANCGAVIVDGRTTGYCDSANFTTVLDACLDCALQYDIWQYYGNSVSEAAEGCGLDATPIPANSTTAANSTSVSVTTSQTATSSEGTTTSSPATSSATEGSSTVVTTSATTATAATSSSPTAESADSAGSKAYVNSGLAMVAIPALLACFI
ncbi:hypothetical protein PV05_10225 [Exophiala xenobiotica]|uniref:Uncharacterized protein n=1 Tax=Exophiala xenobiotica TaxID=348802 RepID=A0A0D2CNT3_9EURO|nr:uncharacterized protein PV05_10225 [Exophiala xenobiotica]KIW51512.1 hypothetical protein PV05_10225 [Exophiala xenobiotica]